MQVCACTQPFDPVVNNLDRLLLLYKLCGLGYRETLHDAGSPVKAARVKVSPVLTTLPPTDSW